MAPPKKRDLAAALGVSASMMSRYLRRGCPGHSIEAAVAWRDATIDPALRKGSRLQADTPKASRQAHGLVALGQARAEIHGILGELLAAAEDGAIVVAHLALVSRATVLAGQHHGLIALARQVLRLVPAPLRGRVQVDVAFADAVLGPLLAVVDTVADHGEVEPESDADADALAALLYGLAAGERVTVP